MSVSFGAFKTMSKKSSLTADTVVVAAALPPGPLVVVIGVGRNRSCGDMKPDDMLFNKAIFDVVVVVNSKSS